ncbi:hypothetical protein P9272_29940 [Mesorhizobium sp. WSM4976]|uniref:hypothetical protein n=1 Tax=Mesorhizobium sp. WSM4976 TaxID=3038549 RepID=UPI0024181191|nr:hypothetical protein [Mesorhizobium sp. WSM4976]MDG4897765.1 hypothetical protein [Mesorhizobium sp. WSM4976]
MTGRSGKLTPQDAKRILADLRRKAILYRGDEEAGDDLVQFTLETAIDEYASRPADVSLGQWLHTIMARHLN